MVCRKLAELPHTAVQGHCPPFLQFIWHGNRLSRGLQSTSARAMAPICVHRAPRTPPDIAPGHIRPRDDLTEAHRTATHSRTGPLSPFLQFIWHGNRHSRYLQGIFARAMAPICVHRARRTPPDIATRHISSRDDLPESVTSIDDYAFRDCTNLTSTYIKATSLSIYGVNTFAYCPTMIYVPLGSEETYKNRWSDYASRIFGYDYSAAE